MQVPFVMFPGKEYRIPLFFVAIILALTIVSYLPLLHNQSFVWDDEGYITNNPLVLSFDLKKIFTANVMGNYHPVTVLVLALEHLVFGLNANGYHLFHLILLFLPPRRRPAPAAPPAHAESFPGFPPPPGAVPRHRSLHGRRYRSAAARRRSACRSCRAPAR